MDERAIRFDLHRPVASTYNTRLTQNNPLEHIPHKEIKKGTILSTAN